MDQKFKGEKDESDTCSVFTCLLLPEITKITPDVNSKFLIAPDNQDHGIGQRLYYYLFLSRSMVTLEIITQVVNCLFISF